jgi:nitrate/TMAO reductase-like tetraheme cytochrome c subunit
MRGFVTKRSAKLLAVGALLGAGALAASAEMVVLTSSTAFCITCHEMRIVAEQGWMRSKHYDNPRGVVAECHSCHIEPDLAPMMRTKTRDGLNDVYVHLFGRSKPREMDWAMLALRARGKVADSSCRRCHQNLTPTGATIKGIVAHREYGRMGGRKRCVDCHRDEFHGGFRAYLFARAQAGPEGDR